MDLVIHKENSVIIYHVALVDGKVKELVPNRDWNAHTDYLRKKYETK